MTSSTAMGLLVIVLFTTFLGDSLVYSELDYDFCDKVAPRAEMKSLKKRNVLTFPPDSLLQINVGISLAGQLQRNGASVVLSFQQNTPLPAETSPFFSPSFVVKARKFSIYDHLRDVISSYGLNGSECLRKMICQIGETPLLGGLLEDVITFVLSPSEHRTMQSSGVEGNQNRVDSLLESEVLGKLGGNCTAAFPMCVRTPLDVISATARF